MADGEPTLLLPDEDCPATQLDEEDETSDIGDHGTTFAKATGFPSPPATPQPRKRKQAPSTGLADTPDKACRRSPRLRELQKLQAEQAPEVPAPAPRRHQASTGGQKILAEAPLRPVIALSGVEIEANLLNAARRLVESLGGEITNTWTMQATHLVACRLRRTFKIMCALCRGVPIVRPAFIKRCVQEARVSEVRNQDLLRDIIGQQIFAKRFLGRSQRYSLGDVLQRAQDRPLLANYCVYVLPEVTTMERPKLRALVEAAGGQWQEVDVSYRDVTESEARRKLKQYCSGIAPRIAALSGATSPKESEAFCARMVREHGGDMLDAKSMGEDLKSFCEQDDFCRPGRDAQADRLVEGILTNFQRDEN
eukprot:s254_g13.t10